MKHQFGLCLFLWACGIHGVVAQPMIEAEMTGQPLLYSTNGIVHGCGVRVVGVTPFASNEKTFKSFDVSANFSRLGPALVKMIGRDIPVNNPGDGKDVRKVLKNGWIKAEGRPPAGPTEGEFIASASEKGTYAFLANRANAMDFLFAVVTDSRVQVAVHWDEKVEWIYFGTVSLTLQEKIHIMQCVKELTAKQKN